jgi:NAD(P)H-quinone oxidoreductase subunit 5
MFPTFSQFSVVMDTIAWTGCLTAFLGATIALTQLDLKKGLAYSTVSQLGYMMMAMGVGSYSAALFHLITHAYSKALLFLGSGSAIHGMEGAVGFSPLQNQNMNLMGGLRKRMPITAITFLIGTLSICGFPPFACFWSKDAILADLFEANFFLWLFAWLTAGLTSFYMFRIYFLTFEGSYRGEDISLVKESGKMMLFPLVVLTLPTLFLGLFGTPFQDSFKAFLENSPPETFVDWEEFFTMAGSSIGIGLLGFTFSFAVYYKCSISRVSLANWYRPFYEFSLNKWYLDDLYDIMIVKGNRKIAQQILFFDQYFIDGIVNFTGIFVFFTGEGLRYTETGRFQVYASSILFVLIGFIGFFFFQFY